MSSPKYHTGDRVYFRTMDRQLVSGDILKVKHKLLFPWSWKYLVKFKVDYIDWGYTEERVKWLSEWRII